METGKGMMAEVSAKLNKQKVLFILVNPLQLACATNCIKLVFEVPWVIKELAHKLSA